MEDLKKKINFDPALLYYTPASEEENIEEEKQVETYNSTNRKHICTVCGKRFFTNNSLNTHFKTHSSCDNEIKNNISSPKQDYIWNNKGIKCNKSVCNYIALDSVEYSKHIVACSGVRVTKETRNVSFCEFCDHYFSSESHLKAHLILEHPDSGPDISLKDCDSKHTTVSDPISFYSHENNSVNDENDSKNIKSHLKYPDSISKKKLKDQESEISPIEDQMRSAICENSATPITSQQNMENNISANPPSNKDDNDCEEKNDCTRNLVEECSAVLSAETDCLPDINPTEQISKIVLNDDNISADHAGNLHSKAVTSTVDHDDRIIAPKNITVNINHNEANEIATSEVTVNGDENTEMEIEILKDTTNKSSDLEPVIQNEPSETNLESVIQNEPSETNNLEELSKTEDTNNINCVINSTEDEKKEEIKHNVEDCDTSDKNVDIQEEHHELRNIKNTISNEAETKEEKDVETSNIDLIELSTEDHMQNEQMEMSDNNCVKNESETLEQVPVLDSTNDTDAIDKEKEITINKIDSADEDIDQVANVNESESAKSVLKTSTNIESTNHQAADNEEESELVVLHSVKRKYMKSYSLLNKKAVRKVEEFTHSTPIPKEILDADNSILSNESVPNESSDEKKSNSFTDVVSKERSVRQRKKLILPDFEYEAEYLVATNKPSAVKNPVVVKQLSVSESTDSSGPKKRGRPKKIKLEVSLNTDTSSINEEESTGISDTLNNSETMEAVNSKETPKKTNKFVSETYDSSEMIDESLTNVSVIVPAVDTDKNNLSDLSKEVCIDESVNISTSEPAIKKKRGRPKKVTSQTSPVKITQKEETAVGNLDKVAKSSPVMLKKVAQKTDSPKKLPINLENKGVIIKRKSKHPKIIVMNNIKKVERNIADITMEPVFDMKSVVELETPSTSIDLNTLSFSDANKFDKVSEEPELKEFISTSVDDVNVVPDRPKRGRPKKSDKILKQSKKSLEMQPKLHTKFSLQMQKVKHPIKKKVKAKLLENSNHKIADVSTPINNHLDPVSFSLLQQNNGMPKKRGRPSKASKEAQLKAQSSLDVNTSEETLKNGDGDILVQYVQNEDSLIDASVNSVVSDEGPTTDTEVIKKKRGRRPKLLPEIYVTETKEKTVINKDAQDTKKEIKPKLNKPKLIDNSVEEDPETKKEETAAVEETKKTTKQITKSSPPSLKEEPKDETININRELYFDDLKNKTKYAKLFKKANDSNDEKFPNDAVVTCGRCKMQMTFRHYKTYHQLSHYYLCWLDGEPEIDLHDDNETTKILQSFITPEALRRKAIRLACEKCKKVRKSVVGYISHVRFCQQEDTTELLEQCKECGKALRPCSLRFHYIKFHSKSYFTHFAKDDVNSIENETDESMLKDSADTTTDTSIIRKRYLKGFEKKLVQKQNILEDEEFWANLKTSYDLYMCMGLSCRHMTLSKEDLKIHVQNCSSNFSEFACSSCSYKTKYESEIIYHAKKNCKDTSGAEDKSNEVDSIAAGTSLEPARRISTRIKKRKFKYDDYNDMSSDDDEKNKRKKKKDSDYRLDKSDYHSDDHDYASDGSNVAEKKFRPRKRKLDLSESNSSEGIRLRQAFQQYCAGRSDPLSWTVDLRLKLFTSLPLHVELKLNLSKWEAVRSSEVDEFIPKHQKSIKILSDNLPSIQFDIFHSDIIKGVPMFFAGGPVWSLAWAPLPANVTEQYLAVSTLQHMNQLIEVNSPITFQSLIQFWKYTSIDNISNELHKPTLSWAMAHNFGAVWSMEWCPSGGFNNFPNACRLGLLAIATSSGRALVYSIPRLDFSADISSDPKNLVMNPQPELILKVKNENVQCTRIIWNPNSPHNILIGGFSDGNVAFWNISTKSTFLRKGNTVYPYQTIEAHNTAITALDLHWLSNGRFLLTGSSNRLIKVWDLNDLSGPMYENERVTFVTNALWMQHWIVTGHVHDYGSSTNDVCSAISHLRDLVERRKAMQHTRDTFWSLSYSYWNDMVATSTYGGLVSAYGAKHLTMLSYKYPEFDKVVTSTELVSLKDEEKNQLNADEIISDMPSCDGIFDCADDLKNFGIKFSDRIQNAKSSESLNFNIEKSNLTSINRVCWNPNYNSFNWLAIGYECGFVRVMRVERFDKLYLTKFYKTNENNTTFM